MITALIIIFIISLFRKRKGKKQDNPSQDCS